MRMVAEPGVAWGMGRVSRARGSVKDFRTSALWVVILDDTRG